jgi:hypothetical protein
MVNHFNININSPVTVIVNINSYIYSHLQFTNIDFLNSFVNYSGCLNLLRLIPLNYFLKIYRICECALLCCLNVGHSNFQIIDIK